MAEYNDPNDAFWHAVDSHLADRINTALECVVVAYNKGRVDVRPIGTKNYTDGDSNAFPTLYGLPMHWPQGDAGSAGVKVPVKVGDKVLAIFSQQPQDDGDTENTRRFSMADGYVVPGVSYDDAHPANDNMRMYYGGAFIEITPDGDVNINCKTLTVNGETAVKVNTPMATFSEQVTVQGMFTFNGGATGHGAAGSASTMSINGKVVLNGDLAQTGAITSSGEITSGTIKLRGHHHTAQGATSATTVAQA